MSYNVTNSDFSAKATTASPALTGNPTAPTQSVSDDDTSIATTAFVHDLLDANTVYFSNKFTGIGSSGSPIELATDPATKQDALVSGTNIKTVNSTTLLGSGNISVQATLVSGTNLKTVNSTTLLGSGDLAVQAVLVSGTNIKTINGASILGSGDLTVSGGGGSQTPWVADIDAAQYSLDSVKTLDVRVEPTAAENLLLYSEVLTNGAWSGNSVSLTDNQGNDLEGNNTLELLSCSSASSNYFGQTITVLPSTTYWVSWDVKRGTATDVYWGIRDQSNFNDLVAPVSYYSSTSASVGRVQFSFTTTSSTTSITIHPYYLTPVTGDIYLGRVQLALTDTAPYAETTSSPVSGGSTIEVLHTNSVGNIGIGTTTVNTAAKVQIDSTTQGFLLPRMTTTQKNAVSSPPEGLIIYDTTLHKLCVRTASAWETITSS